MNGELALNISYFGKLPSRGDFLKAQGNNHQLIAMLDRWAGQGLEQLSQDVAWKQLYDMGHPLNFAILGSRSRAAIAGHLLPSTDASGRRQEVRGEGVVGEQPVLAPGERFEYTSGVPLSTASGFMTGRYQMVSESGERFEIDVPTFSLDSPDGKRVLN